MEYPGDREQDGSGEHPAGLDLAYDLLPATYDWTLQRLTTMENRIQALIILSASFLLTGPALVALAADNVSFDSAVFWLALGVAMLNLAGGVFARQWGKIQLPGPRSVRGGWLELSATDFKREYIRVANEHIGHNLKLVNYKGTVAVWMSGAFLLETLLLVIWGIMQAQ